MIPFILFFLSVFILSVSRYILYSNDNISNQDVAKPNIPSEVISATDPDFLYPNNHLSSYPILCVPHIYCDVSLDIGERCGIKGFTEDRFKSTLLDVFSESLDIRNDVLLVTTDCTYEPDFTIKYTINDRAYYFDVEIDEPYIGAYKTQKRKPIHYIGEDTYRNKQFTTHGWIVIRFSEYQVFTEALSCCKYIALLIKSMFPDFIIPLELLDIPLLSNDNLWLKEQAIVWSKQKFREKYLGIDCFFEGAQSGECVYASSLAAGDVFVQKVINYHNSKYLKLITGKYQTYDLVIYDENGHILDKEGSLSRVMANDIWLSNISIVTNNESDFAACQFNTTCLMYLFDENDDV